MTYTIIAIVGILFAIELYMRFFGNYCEPWFDKKEKILKRKPNTEGVYKTEFTGSGYFRINNEGWNSHRDYYRRNENGKWNKDGRRRESNFHRSPKSCRQRGSKATLDKNGKQEINKIRIAIVGHSNIEGLRVPVDKTLSKILEDDLNQKGIHAEVYIFGFGGMHLAQAMHVSRYVVDQFQPDLLIVGTMLDDFWVHSTSKKNFLNLSIDNESVQEVLPKKYMYEENSPFSFLYFSKLIHYFDLKTRLGERISSIIKKREYQNCNNEKQEINTYDKERAYEYIFNEFKKITQEGTQEGTQVAIPVFILKYPGIIPSYNYDFETQKSFFNNQNNLLEKYINPNTFKVIELETAFLSGYKVNGQNFDFENDHHYNQQAHKVIGMHLSDFIQLYF